MVAEIVVGLTLKNLRPAVWNGASAEFVGRVRAVMLSFEEFRSRPALVTNACQDGIARAVLKLASTNLRIYLDNGAFACLRRGAEPDTEGYCQFIQKASPDWYPVPADYIPLPSQSRRKQRELFDKTVQVMRLYVPQGYCPVIHPGPWLTAYMEEIATCGPLPQLAIGGLVPHLLNSKGAQRKATIQMVRQVRQAFSGRIHAFGIGGIVTLHLAAALGIDSADSSGWRQRAARGLVLLRGRGERQAVALGKWKGRALTAAEWTELEHCRCRGCLRDSKNRLRQSGIEGFAARAAHNLSVLLDEGELIRQHLGKGDFPRWSPRRIGQNKMADLVRFALDEATG